MVVRNALHVRAMAKYLQNGDKLMHLIQVEQQTIDTLVEALEAISSRGFYELNKADSTLLASVRKQIDKREFLTVAEHNAIVQMAIRYL